MVDMPLRYTVGVTLPDQATADRWLAWLRDGHIADVLGGGATAAQVCQLAGGGFNYEVVYRFPSPEAFAAYERDHAPRLRAEGLRLFPVEAGITYRRGVAEIVEEWGPG